MPARSTFVDVQLDRDVAEGSCELICISSVIMRSSNAFGETVGYSVVGYTITPARPGVIPPNPFYPPYQRQVSASTLAQSQSSSHEMGDSAGSVPFPEYDPRWAPGRKGVKQIGRLHLIVDDSSVHGLVSPSSSISAHSSSPNQDLTRSASSHRRPRKPRYCKHGT